MVNTGGGTKTASDFTFSVNGGTAAAFEADGQNELAVAAGTYTVTEPATANYTATYSNCGNVALAAGGTATCTITNTYVPEDSDNIVPNPSLEISNIAGDAPLSWEKGGWGTNTPVYSYLESGHTGSRSIKVQITDFTAGDAKWYFVDTPVAGGKSYLVSDWYQSNIPSEVYVAVNMADGSSENIELERAPASQTWTQYAAYITLPANAISVSIYHSISAAGWLITDDYSMVQQDPDTPVVTDNVPNASLEQSNASNTNPLAWNSDSWGTNTPVYSYLNTGHTGTHSAKVQITSFTDGDAKWYFDYAPIDAGQAYVISDWYQSNIDTLVYASVNKSDGTSQNYLLKMAPASTSWAKYSDVITMPANAVSYSIFHVIAGVGWLITDDYSAVPTTVTGFNRGLVTLTFDDGQSSVITDALPLLDKYGFKTTQFIVSTDMQNTDEGYYMDEEQVGMLYSQGHEIGSHSATHPDLTQMTVAQIDQELSQSKNDLNVLFPPVNHFALPYGLYNNTVIGEAKKYYQTCRTTDQGYNNLYNFDPYGIKTQYVLNTTTVSEVQDWVSQAAQDKSWLVILYHYVGNTGGDEYTITPAQLDAQLNAIKNSGLAVVTTQQALDEIVPQLPE